MKKKAKGAAKAKARKPMRGSAMRDLELMDPAAKAIKGGRAGRYPRKRARDSQ